MAGGEGCSMGTGTKRRWLYVFFSQSLILGHSTDGASESFLSLVYPSTKTAGVQLTGKILLFLGEIAK